MTSAAALFQRNKQLYVNEENKLESIVGDETFLQTFQSWLDTTIAQLDYQYERCEQQLSELQQNVAVQGGSFWCSKTIIDHCNLYMSEKRLVRREGGRILSYGNAKGDQGEEAGGDGNGTAEGEDLHAQLPDLIRLISSLQQTKEHSYMTPKQRQFIEDCEAKLKTVMFEPRDLLFITNALQTKLRDDGNTRGVFGDLTAFQNSIEELSPDVDQCEQLLEASIANGEMGLAEDISQRQLEIYQHILTLITDQYPIIANYYSESRNSDRRRRWAIFRMADKDITAVIESKYRQIEACEEDLAKIDEQTKNYSSDDVEQRRRYEADRKESDLYLQQNKEKQQGVWNRVFGIFQELQTCQQELASLARQRKKEIERRLHVEEREAGRRSGHDAFLRAAADHAQRLQDTINNAHAAKDIAQALNEFVLDGCDSIAAKYDMQQAALSEMLRLVQQHHFKRYSDYYVAASRYLYRKEHKLEQIEEEMDANDMQRELLADRLDPNAKGFAEANSHLALKRREAAQEVLHIRHKLEKAEKAIEPTLRSLDFAGIAYVHPRVIVEQMNLNRWSTILSYKEFMNPSLTNMEKLYAEERKALEKLKATMEDAGVLSVGPDGELHSNTRRLRQGNAHHSNAAGSRQASGSGAGWGGNFTALGASATASGGSRSMTGRGMSALERRVQSMRAKPLLPPLYKEGVAATTHAPNTGSFSSGTAAKQQRLGTTGAGGGIAAGTTAAAGGGKPFSTYPGVNANTAAGNPQSLSTSATVAAAGSGGSGVPGSYTATSSAFNPPMGGSTAPSSGAAGVPKRMEGTTFTAVYSYKARAPDELSFDAGARIVCVSRAPEEGWFRGVCEQRTGLFPINYVEPA